MAGRPNAAPAARVTSSNPPSPRFRSSSGGWLSRARESSIPCDSSVPPFAAKTSRKPSRSTSRKKTAQVTDP